MKVYILDDEQKAITTLQFLLSEYIPDTILSGSSTDPATAREEILLKKPDLLFLDISMPLENGLEFAKTIELTKTLIVFVTAHPNHAIDAFKVNAFDYLLKPVQVKDLLNVINRCKKALQARDTSQGHVSSKMPIKVRYEGKTILVETENILYISSEGNYTKINLLNGKFILLSKNIKQIEALYFSGSPFFRIHQSFIINLTKISSYSSTEATLADHITLPVSRQKKDSFLSLMESL